MTTNSAEYQREYLRKRRQTPGTYEHNSLHGLGEPGTLKKMRDRRYDRRIADARDDVLLVELQKRIGEFNNGSTRNT